MTVPPIASPPQPSEHESAKQVASWPRMLASLALLLISALLTGKAPADAPYLRPLMLFAALPFFVAGIGVLNWAGIKPRLDAVPRHQRPALVLFVLLLPLALAHAMHAWTRLPGWSLIFYAWIFVVAGSSVLSTRKHREVST